MSMLDIARASATPRLSSRCGGKSKGENEKVLILEPLLPRYFVFLAGGAGSRFVVR